VKEDRRRSRAAQLLALSPRSFDSRPRPLDEPSALLLRNPAEYRDEQRPDGPAGVEPRLTDTDDWNADTIEFEHCLNRTDHAAMEAIESPHEDRADPASPCVGEHPVQYWPILRSRLDLRVEDGVERACGRQLAQFGDLVLGGLPVGRNADVQGGRYHGGPKKTEPGTAGLATPVGLAAAARPGGPVGALLLGHVVVFGLALLVFLPLRIFCVVHELLDDRALHDLRHDHLLLVGREYPI
jgi:hypothetical protein